MVQYNFLLTIFLVIFAARTAVRWILTHANIGHLRKYGQQVPHVFDGEIDNKTLSRMASYTVDSSRLELIKSFFDDIVMLVVLLSGLLPRLVETIQSYRLHFIISGFLFFAVLAAISACLDIPFSLYRTFVIEKKHGFSTVTPRLWITDMFKKLLISVLLMIFLFCPLLALIYYTQRTWWLLAWMFFASFQLLVLWLYPIVIAPLFNRYEPIKDRELEQKIISIMDKAELKTEGVYQVDAGRRSKHSNAYFTGIGKTKRIVLFDTLLASHTTDEILAVISHETGHWKKRHILKRLAFVEIASFFLFYLVYLLIEWPPIYHTFGFEQNIPYAGLFLLSALLGPLSFFLTPLISMASRKFEKEADDYSYLLMKTARPLCSALKRLAKDNLANLHPHPIYAWFYHSHPTLTERIARLQQMEDHLQGRPPQD